MNQPRTAQRARSGNRQRQDTPQSRAVVPFDEKAAAQALVSAVDARRDQFMSFLQATPAEYDRFVNVAIDAIVRDKNLLRADRLSLIEAIRHSAIMGLEPTSVMGEGAIVVYNDSSQGKKLAQFQPMVRGLMKLARNSGEIAAIGVDVVRRQDHFVYRSGSDPVIEHEPYIEGLTEKRNPDEEGNDVVGAYAFLKLRSGELLPLFMSTAEIHKRRQVSRSWQSSGEGSIWGKWPEEMMKKTVLRRLMQERAPLSFRAQAALALDAEIDSADGDPEKVTASVSRTARRLTAHVGLDEGPQDGSGAPSGDGAGSGATDGQNEAQGASTGATGDADVVDGQVKEVAESGKCLATPPADYSGGPCEREVHDEGNHRNAEKESWSEPTDG